MKPQVPAEGIVQMNSQKDAKYYKVPCKCGCDANIDFFIEVDEFAISATFCSTTKTNYWRERINVSYTEPWLLLNAKMFLNDMYNRLAVVWQAVVHGYIQTEAYVILTPQQCLNFSETLKTAITDYEVIVEERKIEHAKAKPKLKKPNV